MSLIRKFCFVIFALLWLTATASAQTTITGTTCPGAGCVTLPVGGQGSIGVQITGTFSGTITFTASIDGVNFASFPLSPLGGGPAVATTTATGIWNAHTGPVSVVRVAFTSFVSGSAVVSNALATAAASATNATLVGTNTVVTNDQPQTAAANALSSVALSTITTSVNVKASAGNVYGVLVLNGAASTCWVQFINSAGAGTLGTAVLMSVPLPASTTQPTYVQPAPFALSNHSTGIAVGIATTATGAVACGTGGNLTVFYK